MIVNNAVKKTFLILLLVIISILPAAHLIASPYYTPAGMLGTAFLYAAVFYFTYKIQSSTVLLTALLGSSMYITAQFYLLYRDACGPKPAAAIVPLVGLLVGLITVHMSKHSINKHIKKHLKIFKGVGTAVTAVSIFALSFPFFLDGFQQIYRIGTGPLWVLYILSALLGSYVISSEGKNFSVMMEENSPWLLLDVLIFIILLIPFNEIVLFKIINTFVIAWSYTNIKLGYRTADKLHTACGVLLIIMFFISLYYKAPAFV
ncbi:MAG: hypothetical protein H0Z40_10340 [Desulfotomaculum sp.]|nr:hypothetical protein [Desulfotomaculum sp.]